MNWGSRAEGDETMDDLVVEFGAKGAWQLGGLVGPKGFIRLEGGAPLQSEQPLGPMWYISL